MLQHEAFICQHVEPRQKGECGSRIYILQMPGGLRFLAEVTVAEMLYMKEKQMTVEEVLAFLGSAAA